MDRRFLTLAVSFLASIGFVYFLLSSEYHRVTSRAEREVIGVQYLHPVKSTMRHLPEHRWLLREYLDGDPDSSANIRRIQSQIDEAVEQLTEAEARYGERVGTTVSVKTIAKDWRDLKSRSFSISRLESEQAHNDLLNRLRELISDIGDKSGLVLDPDLDSYYLMDVIVTKLPDMQDLLPQVIDVSAQLIDSQGMSPIDRTHLTQLLGLLQSTLNKMEKNYNRAFSFQRRRPFQQALENTLQDFAGTCEGYLNTLYSAMLETGGVELTKESAHMLGVKLHGKSFDLWDETAAGLEKILKKRLGEAQQRNYLASAFTMLLALFTIGIAFLLVQAMRERQNIATEKERLAQAVDAASDGIVITDPNQPDNPVIYVNASFTRLTGYGPEEVLGRNCRFLAGPKTNPDATLQLRQAVNRRQSVKVTLLNYRKDGSTFWNGLRISPIFSANGDLKYFLGFQADVTERIQAEQQIIAERDYTSSIIRGTPAVICGIGTGGQTRFLNPAGEKVTGYRADELIGRNWWNTLYPDEDYRQVEALFEKFKSGDVRDHEMTHKAKNGERHTVSWSSLNRYDEKGKLSEIIQFGNDVTERKKLEMQLQQSQKMETVGTLAGGIAHDLNNQLTPLSGYLDLVIRDIPVSDPRRTLLMEAEQAARRCAEVVQRIMNVSRPSTQKKKWLRLDSLFAECKRLFAKTFPSTIHTEVDCDPDIWPVLANDTELQTVLMNMAVNSRDAMRDGGKLTISALNRPMREEEMRAGFPAGNYVLITIEDTGAGIHSDTLPKIFEPFFTTKPKGHGTGLGLAMGFRIVKDHGGWIDAASQPGSGTLMSIYLPADPDQKVEAEKSGESPQKLPGGHETILFADDEETLRNLGRVFLERLGYQVILARDGQEAVDLYKNKHKAIDAVVLDMTMPKLTGKQTIKKILEIDPKARILLASGFTAEGTAKDLISEGATDFLPKPYTLHPLAQMLRKVLDK